jgi:hypothetical protein
VGHGVEVLEKFVPRHPYRAWVGTSEITPPYRHHSAFRKKAAAASAAQRRLHGRPVGKDKEHWERARAEVDEEANMTQEDQELKQP